ncbi:hypothetical protein OAM67_00410 [bacterium]|nr:hypothetical protein [bacterium]
MVSGRPVCTVRNWDCAQSIGELQNYIKRKLKLLRNVYVHIVRGKAASRLSQCAELVNQRYKVRVVLLEADVQPCRELAQTFVGTCRKYKWPMSSARGYYDESSRLPPQITTLFNHFSAQWALVLFDYLTRHQKMLQKVKETRLSLNKLEPFFLQQCSRTTVAGILMNALQTCITKMPLPHNHNRNFLEHFVRKTIENNIAGDFTV